MGKYDIIEEKEEAEKNNRIETFILEIVKLSKNIKLNPVYLSFYFLCLMKYNNLSCPFSIKFLGKISPFPFVLLCSFGNCDR